jgi:peptidoglycan/xylan/chitin deacetylase (PgdA/CDA1 family)
MPNVLLVMTCSRVSLSTVPVLDYLVFFRCSTGSSLFLLLPSVRPVPARLTPSFHRHGINATINVTTSALEKAPYWGKKLAASRHELSCGGKRWIDYFEMDPKEEEKHIVEAIEFMEKTTGKAPKGAFSSFLSSLLSLSRREFARSESSC